MKAGGARRILLPLLAAAIAAMPPARAQLGLSSRPAAIAGLPVVADNAALSGATAGRYSYVYRAGRASAGDGGQMLYAFSKAPCSLDGGDGDDGFQVAPSGGGGCYIAQIAPGGAELALWGVPAGGDDTALIRAADRAMGSADWPHAAAKTLYLPPTTVAMGSPGIGNIAKIVLRPGTVVTAKRGMGATGGIMDYVGAGPFEVDFNGGKFACASYAGVGAFVEPAHCGNDMLLIQRTGNAQVTGVTIRRGNFFGGNNDVVVYGAQDVDIEIDDSELPFGFAVVVSGQVNTRGVSNNHAAIVIKKCVNAGQYCLSAPVNGPPTELVAARDFRARIDSCVGAGFIAGKGCADFPTGEAGEAMHFDVYGVNANFGVEAKRTGEAAAAYPNALRDRTGSVVLHQNIDTGACLQIPYENSAAAAARDRQRNGRFTVTCTGDLPAARLADTYYPAGAVWTANGKTYQVILGGTTAGDGGPRGTAPNTGIADGSAIVSYREQTPRTLTIDGEAIPDFVNLVGVEVEANTNLDLDLTAYNVAYGYLLDPRGSSDNAIRDLTLRLRGRPTKACLQDTYSVLFGGAPRVDRVTLLDWNCQVIATGNGVQNALAIGNGDGAGHFIAWTNLHIAGGLFVGGPDGYGALRNYGGAVSGTIVGAQLVGGRAAIYAQGETNLKIIGGALATTAARTSGVISGRKGSSGTIALQPSVAVDNSDPLRTGTLYKAAGSSLSVVGQAVNPPLPAPPDSTARKCTPGVDVAYSATDGHKYFCAAPGTWRVAY